MRRRYIYIAIGIVFVGLAVPLARRVLGFGEDLQTILVIIGASAVILVGTRGYADLAPPLEDRSHQRSR